MTAFEELDDSLEFEIDVEGGLTARRRLMCDWGDWQSLVDEIIGYSQGSAILHAPFPGFDNLYCTNVTVTPFKATKAEHSPGMADPVTEVATYTGKAVLSLKYKTVLVDFDGTPFGGTQIPDSAFVDYSVNSTGEFFMFEASDMRWTNQPTVPVKAQASRFISMKQHSLSFYNIESPPFNAIESAKGHVNASAWLGFPAETLLFEGASFQTRLLVVQSQSISIGWNFTYNFTDRIIRDTGGPYGWNHSWRGATEALAAGWDKLKKADGSYNYPTTSFNSLFAF